MSEQYPGAGSPAGPPPEDARHFGVFDTSPAPSAGHPPFVALGGPPPPPVPDSTRPARRRPMRSGAVLALAAAIALVVGGGAGYGGARLAAPTADEISTAPARPADPTATPSSEPPTDPDPGPRSTIDAVSVATRTVPSTVMIKVGRSTGSGFVFDAKGRILTNNHVVAGAADGSTIRVVFADGKRQKATLVGRSPSYDVAVIKVKPSSRLRPVARGDAGRTRVGEPVLAVGSPLGLPGTVTQGIVSARNRPVAVKIGADADSPTAYIDAIQTDAPINPGNSGGPLINAAAQVIGINSAILTLGAGSGQTGNIGLGFAIPIDQVTTIARQLIKNGRATYPVLGATVENASGGVELTSVERRGPAATAGLKSGDLVTEIDGDPVSASEEFIVDIRTRRPGQKIELLYNRGSRERTTRVTLGSKVG